MAERKYLSYKFRTNQLNSFCSIKYYIIADSFDTLQVVNLKQFKYMICRHFARAEFLMEFEPLPSHLLNVYSQMLSYCATMSAINLQYNNIEEISDYVQVKFLRLSFSKRANNKILIKEHKGNTNFM